MERNTVLCGKSKGIPGLHPPQSQQHPFPRGMTNKNVPRHLYLFPGSQKSLWVEDAGPCL
jgi:hypothetical protein